MKLLPITLAVALSVGGCTTNTAITKQNLTAESTLSLCRMLTANYDQAYKAEIVRLLVKRGASAEKCQRLVASDNSVATGVAVAGLGAAAAAVAANNGGYGGGGYYPPSYGVAWDQFYGANYTLIWRCRDRATGRFVYDGYCGGLPMVDSTWPGWSA
ncbi:hypothetical protein ACFWXH_04715 [Mesorhizobium sp. NPDC059054]|uniref:hypothetical protein n=1 Tax=Mesorhizobium sp. NPDC059054 TaxID=3346711 RepID=UPI00369EE37E